MTAAVIGARPALAGAGEPRVSTSIGVLVLLLFAVSSIVVVEPAPSDILFVPVLFFAVAFGHLAAPDRFGAGVVLPAVLLVVANLVSAFFSLDFPRAGFYLAVTLYMLALAAFVASIVARYGPGILAWIARGFTLAAVITAGIGVLARFHLIPMAHLFFRDESGMRIKSTFKDPNVFAPFLVAAAMVTLASLVESRRPRLRDAACFALFAVGILLAFSRGAWLHLAVSLGVFAIVHLFVLRRARARRRLVLSGVVLAAMIVPLAGWLLLGTDLGEYFGERLSLQDYDSERFGAQALALQVACDNPLGIGPGQWLDTRFGLSTHNLYLRVLAENGFLGLFALIALIVSSLAHSVRGVLARGECAGWHVASLSIVVGILVESLVIDSIHWRHFWLFLALPIGLRAYETARRDGAQLPARSGA